VFRTESGALQKVSIPYTERLIKFLPTI